MLNDAPFRDPFAMVQGTPPDFWDRLVQSHQMARRTFHRLRSQTLRCRDSSLRRTCGERDWRIYSPSPPLPDLQTLQIGEPYKAGAPSFLDRAHDFVQDHQFSTRSSAHHTPRETGDSFQSSQRALDMVRLAQPKRCPVLEWKGLVEASTFAIFSQLRPTSFETPGCLVHVRSTDSAMQYRYPGMSDRVLDSRIWFYPDILLDCQSDIHFMLPVHDNLHRGPVDDHSALWIHH